MKIAAAYENGMIFQHFGHTQQFKFYEIEDNNIVKEEVVSTMGSGHSAVAGFLKAAIAQVGIKLYGGANGSADEAVKALITGTLKYNPDVKCNHHNHEHGESGHTCGQHGCGNHNCH